MGFKLRLVSSLLIILYSSTFTSHAADVLKKGQSIHDGGETLISPGKVFELGFFSPGKSTKRYVGIWYHGLPTISVVWVANREVPIHTSSGGFTLQDSGTLAVIDEAGRVIWSSNSTSASKDTIALLMDSGNLMLRESLAAEKPVWQSFDHPGNTFLPGMQVGIDLTNNKNTLYSSWKSEDDPSKGEFEMGNDPRKSTQLMIWKGRKPRWRTGPWNGQRFIGLENQTSDIQYGFKFSNVEAEQKMYLWYTAYNQSKERFVTTTNGTLEQLILNDNTRQWQRTSVDPSTICHIYNFCGDNAVCRFDDDAYCSCLQGFQPRYQEEWNNRNWSRGCTRRLPRNCQTQSNRSDVSVNGGDGFLKLERVRLPDEADFVANVDNVNRCEAVCLRNCSCEAYAYVNGIGCMIWGVELMDIHQFAIDGEVLHVRVDISELATKPKRSKVVLVASIAGAFASAVCVIILLIYYVKRRGLLKKELRQRPLFSTRTYEEDMEGEPEATEIPMFSFQTLAAATDNFSRANLVGEGGFGPVYRGTLNGNVQVAVKRLSGASGQGMVEFKNEVTLIAKLQHRNLVRLLGFSNEQEEKMLIYEYMAKGSLDLYLFDSARRGELDWRKRLSIIEGIARGLVYLHRDSRLMIIHRDLKASNILLDDEMNPKISDFGMARIFSNDRDSAKTRRVVGTYGYMSPEYAMDGLFSVKSDVYSFGVLLLEILSGKKNKISLPIETSTTLIGQAWKLWNENNGIDFMDPSIRDRCNGQEALKCLHIGLLCVQDRPHERPSMPSVVVMLESETSLLPAPKQPAFTANRSAFNSDSSSVSNCVAGLSINYVTTTDIIGR